MQSSIFVAVLFGKCPVKGRIEAVNGQIGKVIVNGKPLEAGSFYLSEGGRLEIEFTDFNIKTGAFPTICNVFTDENPFSFNLRDVNARTPIFIPEFQTAVVPGSDQRAYEQVALEIARRGLISDFTRFQNEPEESYSQAAARNRKQYCQTWLGLGRDMRLFRVGYQARYEYFGQIQPCYHSVPQHFLFDAENRTRLPETAYQINFVIGQGASCRPEVTRRLEEGVLPILQAVQREQDVAYNLTFFATLEKDVLSAETLRGSEWRACYANTGGNMLTAEERREIAGELKAEMLEREQEVVCCLRVRAVNTGKIPRYAWFKAATPIGFNLIRLNFPEELREKYKPLFCDGLSLAGEELVVAVNRLNGTPLADEETAVLLQPGAAIDFEILVPHAPLSLQRAKELMKLDFDAHFNACRAYWENRLSSAAKIEVPEKPINESIRAGLLHCDLVTLGREPDGVVLPTIGWYSPIGTESAPIIQFYDSMGWHKLAERALDFFFARQRPDGFIQNFANYQSETGPFLWTVGEHYRYTGDAAWLKRVWPNIKKSADYLVAWRERNKTAAAKEKGFYGMVDGKVADPNDFYHSFFLNAGTYLGLKRVAEMACAIDPHYAKQLDAELPAYLANIRAGFYGAQARAPVMPLPDGSWAPLMPPWVEYTGGISFYADGGNWFSHGAFASRSCLTGPLWLIIGEVLEPREIGAEFMLKTNQYPVTLDNAALSQPYYCRHDYAHLRRGEVPAFLKTYYNQITALQDHETLTFWEHYYHASEHKTHEEAWFLMQTRWMLWLENGRDLSLLNAVPRVWLADGQEIKLEGVKSYFGPIYLRVKSDLKHHRMTAELCMPAKHLPKNVTIRLPHPESQRASVCRGADYSSENETVVIRDFKGNATVELQF